MSHHAHAGKREKTYARLLKLQRDLEAIRVDVAENDRVSLGADVQTMNSLLANVVRSSGNLVENPIRERIALATAYGAA